MRTIKFRGKNGGGKWVYGCLRTYSHGTYIDDGDGLAIIVDPETVGQYVCKDAKGNDVYEGDIVKNLDDNSIWHVAYSPNEMGFTVALMKPGEFGDTDFEMRWLKDCVVIGNIWDSDETLMEDKE